MSKTALAVAEEETGLSSALQRVRTRIIKEADKINSTGILGRYRIGQMVDEVTKDERQYGENAVLSLAESLDGIMSPNQLWDCRKFSQTYDEDKLKELMERKTASGNMITWTHLLMLLQVSLSTERRRLENRVFSEDLTSDELAIIIQDILGNDEPRRGGGRKPQLPKTIATGLSQIEKFAGEISKREKLWQQAVGDRIAKAGPDELTKETVKRLQRAKLEVENMLESGQHLLESLGTSLDRATGVAGESAEEKPQKRRARKGQSKAALSVYDGDPPDEDAEEPEAAADSDDYEEEDSEDFEDLDGPSDEDLDDMPPEDEDDYAYGE